MKDNYKAKRSVALYVITAAVIPGSLILIGSYIVGRAITGWCIEKAFTTPCPPGADKAEVEKAKKEFIDV